MANNSGLQTNNIYSIVPDKNGNLFLGTENGLSFYNLKEQTFTNWTREQGYKELTLIRLPEYIPETVS